MSAFLLFLFLSSENPVTFSCFSLAFLAPKTLLFRVADPSLDSTHLIGLGVIKVIPDLIIDIMMNQKVELEPFLRCSL